MLAQKKMADYNKTEQMFDASVRSAKKCAVVGYGLRYHRNQCCLIDRLIAVMVKIAKDDIYFPFSFHYEFIMEVKTLCKRSIFTASTAEKRLALHIL